MIEIILGQQPENQSRIVILAGEHAGKKVHLTVEANPEALRNAIHQVFGKENDL